MATMLAPTVVFSMLGIRESDCERVADIIGGAGKDIQRDWFSKLKVEDGSLKHTRYKELKEAIGDTKFKELYALLGYNFEELSRWQDWRCGHGGCVRDAGWSCDPDSCD